MSENDKAPQAAKKRKGVEELLTEVASAAKVRPTPRPAAAPAQTDAPAQKTEAVKVMPSAPVQPPAPPRKLRVTQVKSGICTPEDHKKSLKSLGLRRIRQQVTVLDTPATRGLILKVRHLITVTED